MKEISIREINFFHLGFGDQSTKHISESEKNTAKGKVTKVGALVDLNGFVLSKFSNNQKFLKFCRVVLS